MHGTKDGKAVDIKNSHRPKTPESLLEVQKNA